MAIKQANQYSYSRVQSFVKQYKKGIQSTNQGINVKVDWTSDYVDRQGLREWFVKGLHRKINSNGGIQLEYRDERIDIWRDCQIYTAWVQRKQKTQWGIRFHSKYFKKRFSHIQAQ